MMSVSTQAVWTVLFKPGVVKSTEWGTGKNVKYTEQTDHVVGYLVLMWVHLYTCDGGQNVKGWKADGYGHWSGCPG